MQQVRVPVRVIGHKLEAQVDHSLFQWQLLSGGQVPGLGPQTEGE